MREPSEGARRAGGGLEGLRRPRGRHFVRHGAAQVAFERDAVDHHQRAVAAHHADHAAIRACVAEVRRREDAQRPGAGRERDGGAEILADAAGDHAVRAADVGRGRRRAGGDLERAARACGCVGARAAHRDRAQAAAQPHADVAVRGVAEGDAGVVVLEDRLVLPAVLGVAVAAPLRHADAVAPAVALDEKVTRGRPGAGRAGEEQEREDGEGAGERQLAPAPEPRPAPLLRAVTAASGAAGGAL